MRVQDYEPYPDDGSGYGDYPMIKPVGELEKNPWEAWDFPERRRNYGEVVRNKVNWEISQNHLVELGNKQ